MTGQLSSRGADIDAVARVFLEHVRRNGRNGTWVRGIDAWKAAIDKCRDLDWVRYTEEKPKARSAVTEEIRRLIREEFRDIEVDKRGTYRSAPIFFRVRLA